MRRTGIAFALGGALVAASAFAPPAEAASKPESLRFLSGSAGGAWYPLTVGIAELFDKQGVKTSTEIGGGNSNVVNLGNGVGDLGMTFTVTVADAAQGKDPFKQKITNLRGLFQLTDLIAHMVVSAESGIKTIPELKGRKAALQQQSAGITSIFRMILEAYGMSEKDLNIVTRGGTGQASDALKDRRAEMYLSGGTLPEAAASEVAASMAIRFLPVDDQHFKKLKEINDGFLRVTIPAGVYKGVDADVPAVAVATFAVANAKMPDDYAYWIVKTLADNIATVRKIHKSIETITPKYMAEFAGAAPHPGAARYYKEIGVLK
ncbi:MAG: TAXI family TRAP transporter solute-binding subunit [Proteobacteria bacterium]|nr:TAXI family TRAP transporter solute-binding subunit [Pseudomonadota bacterium]